MRVAVCLITFRRPSGLRAALTSLAAQVFDGEPPDLRVVVVDNDEAGSARAVCDELRPTSPWPLIYDVEPRRGIPHARNRCVALARPEADWIGFLDDDEEAAPGWLAELIRIQALHGADVVTGPVVPLFVGEAPAWALRGRFFHRRRFPTGTLRDRAFTNNVLFRAAIFDAVQPHFDERMVMTGGSDTHFSRRVHRAGYRIVWADQAEVHETFPTSRMVTRWVYQRAYRTGTTTAFIARDLRSLPAAAARLVPDAAYRLFLGALLATGGWIAGRHRAVAGVRHLCYGAGMLVGLFGGRYEEYRRIHGE
jgi:GT2 family glycosyltransferase